MWRDQVANFSDRYRCIAYDHRGQGNSAITPSGYDVDNLTRDAVELIKLLDCGPCHFVGLSMGGFVGIRLALAYPEFLKSVILMDTSADPESFVKKCRYLLLAFIARWFGFKPVLKPVMAIMFGKTWLANPEFAPEQEAWKQVFLDNDRVGATRAALGVIGRSDVHPQLDRISCPCLVIVGEDDVATGVESSIRIHEAVEHSSFKIIPSAGHLSNIERPEAVNTCIEEFLAGLHAQTPGMADSSE